MANEVIGIEVQVKLEQLRAQLATLGPGMEKEAKAMTAALNREIKQQTAAMKAAAKASASVRSESVKAAGDAAANAGTKFDKLAKAAGPLGGVLSRVSPEAGAAASSIAGLASAAEGIAGAGLVASTGAAAAGLAVLAAVVGTVYVAYKIYNADAERAAMIAEEVRSATEKLTPIFDEHEAAVRRLKVATGELSAEQLANLQIGDAAAKRLQDAIGDTSKKVGQLRVEQDSMWTQAVDGIESYAPAWTPLGAAVRAFTVNSEELGTEIDALQGVVTKAIDVTKDQTETDREAVKITDKKTAATKAYSIALAEAAATASVYDKDEFARLLAAKEEKDAAVRQRVKAVQKELDDEKAAKDAAAKADVERAEKTAAAEMAATQVRIATASAVAASIEGLVTQLNDQQLDSIDTTSKAGKRAALQQWEQNKAAATAMATVQAALAIAQAVASAPPPLNIPAIIQNTVAGAAAVASVVAAPPPKFHAGTKRVDEVNATLRTGEAVLSPTGVETAARDVIGRWNSGRSAGGAERPMVIQYRHQVFNQFIRDNLRMSTPLSAAVKTGAAAGFRKRG